jgi:hypothetical protein
MYEERCGQWRAIVLDEERAIRAHEACVSPELGYCSTFRDKDSFRVPSIAISARDARLLRIDKEERMLDGNGQEGKLDGLLASDREGSAFDDFSNLDILQWLVSVKNQPDIVARIPAVALLDFLKKPFRAFLQNLGILLVGAIFADMAEKVVTISPENRRDADIAGALAESVLPDFTRPNPNYQFVADRGVLVNCPGSAIHLCVQRHRKVSEQVLQLIR